MSELYHHGIKGQKWGERRFQYEDGSLTEEGRRRYGVGERIKRSFREHQRYNLQRSFYNDIQAAKKEKTLRGKYSQLAGNARMERQMRYLSTHEKNKAGNSSTNFMKRYHETNSANAEELSKYYAKQHNKDVSQKITEAFLGNRDLMNTPYHKMNGKTSTYGKEYVKNMLISAGVTAISLAIMNRYVQRD